MKIFNYCIIFVLLLVSTSCRKKDYPQSSVEGGPVFNCNMTVNGVPTTFEAGVNDYYMFSSFQQDSNNVYGFIAGIKQNNCTSCPNSIQIQINDIKVSNANAPTNIDSALTTGTYNYFGSNTAAFYTTQFVADYNKTAAAYLWDFGDGTTSASALPSHTYKKAGKYNVSLAVTGNNSCVSYVSSIQNIGFYNNKFRTTIIDSGGFGNSISFFANNSQGTGPYSYLWNFGDGTPLSTVSNGIHNYQHIGSYPLSLRVIDLGTNDTAYAKSNVVTAGDVSSCAANFTLSAVNLTPNALGLSNIILNYTDANGTVYTSQNSLQPNTSYFKIVSVDTYGNNELGQTTKKLHVKFKCTVYNGSNSILLDNADAMISVAYK